MEQRLNPYAVAPGAYKALLGVHQYLTGCGLEPELLHVVFLRASQLNGCAYCVDMHWKDARAAGVSEQKLSLLPVWREVKFYSERERAALEWAEAVTLLRDREVPDGVYRIAREQFDEKDLVNLTVAIGSINTWNRMNVAFRVEAGNYKPAAAHA